MITQDKISKLMGLPFGLLMAFIILKILILSVLLTVIGSFFCLSPAAMLGISATIFALIRVTYFAFTRK